MTKNLPIPYYTLSRYIYILGWNKDYASMVVSATNGCPMEHPGGDEGGGKGSNEGNFSCLRDFCDR